MYQDLYYSSACSGRDDFSAVDEDEFFEKKEFDDFGVSDEDTEEASESDMGKSEEPTELREQIYQDKLASLKKQLQQLKDGTHPTYNRKIKRIEAQYKERLRLNIIYKDYLTECVERDYILEKKSAAKEFEEKKADLKENLVLDMEEKRKLIEADRYTMELTGDSTEIKPIMTRKLRRRPNEPIPEKVEKRRKPPPAQISYLLEDKEIDNDLKTISRGKVVPAVRKPVIIPHFSQSNMPQQHLQISSESNSVETRIEDGKLLYERRWFHRGQPVYVEGKDLPRFSANISAIGTEAIWVKKVADNSKVRIFINQLCKGKISIKRRAS